MLESGAKIMIFQVYFSAEWINISLNLRKVCSKKMTHDVRSYGILMITNKHKVMVNKQQPSDFLSFCMPELHIK